MSGLPPQKELCCLFAENAANITQVSASAECTLTFDPEGGPN